jgi:hypothetical protein
MFFNDTFLVHFVEILNFQSGKQSLNFLGGMLKETDILTSILATVSEMTIKRNDH